MNNTERTEIGLTGGERRKEGIQGQRRIRVHVKVLNYAFFALFGLVQFADGNENGK
jgi:hypothetical protein